ncbi:MAG: hypothetical protein IV107_12730 [Paucibacter sp.]|nr:hypothetical protein [Roseateles sp.]
MHLRHLLIRLLLLAVCFNTAIGKSAHEVWHLEQATAAVTAPSAEPADDAAASEAQGVCAWCLAHAGLGFVPAPLAAVHGLAWQTGALHPQGPETFVPNPGRWRFAARDPPAA